MLSGFAREQSQLQLSSRLPDLGHILVVATLRAVGAPDADSRFALCSTAVNLVLSCGYISAPEAMNCLLASAGK